MTYLTRNLIDNAFLRALLTGVVIMVALCIAGQARGGTLDDIKKRGKIVVATEAAYPPFEFVKDGKIVGYGKDILDACIEKLGVKLDQLDLPYQGIFGGLMAKKYDFVATAVGMHPERQLKYAFTVPIAEGAAAVMKRAGDSRINKAEDLSGMIVGTQLGSALEKIALAYEKTLKGKGLAGYKELKLFKAAPEVYLSLANGQLDAVIQNSTQIGLMIKEKPGIYETVERIWEKRYMGWIARPDSKDLRDFFSSCIIELRDNGKIYAMQEKWFGFRMIIPDKDFRVPGAQ